jgi:hypothetical protein
VTFVLRQRDMLGKSSAFWRKLMGRSPDELCIIVHTVYGPAADAPAAPQASPASAVEVPLSPMSAAISSPVIETDCASDASPAARVNAEALEASTAAVEAEVSPAPPSARQRLPDAPQARPVNVLGLPKLPVDLGLTFDAVQRTARALGAEAQVEVGGKVQIVSLFGSRVYDDMRAAARALNARSYLDPALETPEHAQHL